MTENMQFPIPNDVLEPFIREAVATTITSALGDGNKLIAAAVQAALSVKVNEKGIRTKDSYYNKYPLVETIAGNAVRKIATETITEMAEQMRPRIETEIKKELKNQHGALAKALVDGLIGSMETSWAVRVELSPTKKV